MLGRGPPASKQRPRASPTPAFLVREICVVGIGASAGGLEACRLLLEALPAATGMAFILVQHLDPTHESLMVELLGSVTAMPVLQATDGMVVETDHVYIIPPGAYLALEGGKLKLSAPLARHGARLPFDFLLKSLAHSAGTRAICVVLSGSGADGAVGLAAIKAAGGLVIAQDPTEAGYDGMPRSAIATGMVDLVLPVAGIAAALARHQYPLAAPVKDDVKEIIGLLKSSELHDFTLYKPATLERRIVRRMGLSGLSPDDTAGYLALLKSNSEEATALAEDLLINVTSFFRDTKIFDLLAENAIAELVAHAKGNAIRLWVAGCSTGEETYTLAMLFSEAIKMTGADIKLQIFASDADAQAVAAARAGVYPLSIEAQVSAARLERFFIREELVYRVAPSLRASVVFAVQDVLADPPFSKLNMISCRNLMIYLKPEAQAKIIEVFHFSLRAGGLLLLGAAETIGPPDGRFAVISKQARLYRKTSQGPTGHFAFRPAGDLSRLTRAGPPAAVRGPDNAELYRKLVLERYAPAAVMVNRRLECLYTSGPIDSFLHIAPGYPTHDLLALLVPALRMRVKAAIGEVSATQKPMSLPGTHMQRHGENLRFDIDIQPVPADPDKFILFFLTQPKQKQNTIKKGTPRAIEQVTALERELETVRTDLQLALKSLEISSDEQAVLSEEALSVNEEYQSTNEELLTSKEELQSLNEELTALNSQLQETLERSRTTLSDLENVLNSSDVATLFLDAGLKIRFFTPAATAMFAVMPGDVGRPLADFRARVQDPALLADARGVLLTAQSVEAEVQTEDGIWFQRRIQPYRTHDGTTAGVVITFADITERKAASAALEAAQRESERANIAKSHFLGAASHDLRQPLQALTLIGALLAKSARDSQTDELVIRLGQTIDGMTGMLNALLDINQIDAGIVQPMPEGFSIQALLTKLKHEFFYTAAEQGLKLRVVPCTSNICADARLLEQMLRNLLANALKYTHHGGVLLGCRHAGAMLRIEIWDSGIGIPAEKLKEIFEEYRQLGNVARERSRGLGLGLSIVKRLSELLGHRLRVRSWPGRGSVFSIDVPVIPAGKQLSPNLVAALPYRPQRSIAGNILLIEDDPDIRQLLQTYLSGEGHHVLSASDGATALSLIATTVQPNLVITDYNLPGQMSGVALISALRAQYKHELPTIIITGDISGAARRDIADHGCVQLNKPMKLSELTATIQTLLARLSAAVAAPHTVFVVDDDAAVRSLLVAVFEADGYRVKSFGDCESFLKAAESDENACLLLDEHLPGMSGFALLETLAATGRSLPAIMITGQGDVKMAVRALRAGVIDFIEKPADTEELRGCVARALTSRHVTGQPDERVTAAMAKIALLTGRQREIMDRVLAGEPSKNIACDLGISQRTVESHRASIMTKTGARSIPALVRLAMTAEGTKADYPPVGNIGET
jgi:two-component system, chemotaxis family, CheB/CheR fusion protein